ncbi:MAG TPA: DUF1697 domain-containing protein [Thermoanaerobaculia bacterium]|nr:DUF1697 domain-containing protein [Thermoanaerobaculia bacterium]
MPVFIAMLRGVNVGGHQKLTSAALKEVCESAGFTAVRTYLQSGNVVFASTSRSRTAIASRLRAALAKRTGVDVAVLLRTPADFRAVIDENPMSGAAEEQPNRFLVAFLEKPLDAKTKALLERERNDPERLHFGRLELYAYLPAGSGTSKLGNVLTAKRLGVDCTTRNWNTVTALLALAEATAAG